MLDAAAELFAGSGLSVSLDAIARQAGVGPGTVHRHFATKESLIAAVAVTHLERLAQTARSMAARPEAAPDGLVRLLSVALEEGLRSTTLKAALAGSGLDARIAFPDVSDQLTSAVASLLAAGQQSGDVRRDIDSDDVMALLAGLFGTLQHAGADNNPRRRAKLAQVLFDGLRVSNTANSRGRRPKAG